MRIYDVCDNRSNGAMKCENGLSLYIEKEDGSFLFDTGRSGIVCDNLKSIGIDIASIQNIVLSHNHNDHTGGIYEVKKQSDATIFLSSDFSGDFYKVKDNAEVLSDNSILESFNNIIKVDDCVEILGGVYLCRVKNVNNEYKCKDKKLLEKVYGAFLEDEFKHELYVAYVENNNIHIISACTHLGIVNVIDDALKRFPNACVKTIVGGLHIKNYMTDEEIEKLTQKLNGYNSIENVYTCHCTGENAEYIMQKNANFNVIKMEVGAKIDICKTL